MRSNNQKRVAAWLLVVLAIALFNLLAPATPPQFSNGAGVSYPLLAPNGSVAAPSYSFANSTGTGWYWTGSQIRMAMAGADKIANDGTSTYLTDLIVGSGFAANARIDGTGFLTKYKNVSTAGWGVPAIYGANRVTAQSAANASIATYTVGGADGSFEVSMNMNVSAVTTLSTTLTCTYTDESNTGRTMILPVQQLTGSFIVGGLITGTGAWETPVMHIRAKASTLITLLTAAGTFSGVTYTAEGIIKQMQ